MDSFSRKIFLSLGLTIVFLTTIGVVWLPKYLEQRDGTPIKELDAVPTLSQSEESGNSAVTRFPTRAISKPSSTTQSGQGSQAQDSTAREMPGQTGAGGLPTREVPGVAESEAGDDSMGDRVTTRAYLRANASVFSQPNMTAQVLGTVGAQTKVRWLSKSSEGWEEILLKNGGSGYVQSKDLSFSADSWNSHQSAFEAQAERGTGPDLSALPSTVETFLTNLAAGDLPRAETFLSPVARRLDSTTLSGLGPYAGAPPLGRVLRIELISGDRDTYRQVVLVYGDNMEHQTNTVWEWDVSQQRWMLMRWD